jgi:hypothetical protein
MGLPAQAVPSIQGIKNNAAQRNQSLLPAQGRHPSAASFQPFQRRDRDQPAIIKNFCASSRRGAFRSASSAQLHQRRARFGDRCQTFMKPKLEFSNRGGTTRLPWLSTKPQNALITAAIPVHAIGHRFVAAEQLALRPRTTRSRGSTNLGDASAEIGGLHEPRGHAQRARRVDEAPERADLDRGQAPRKIRSGVEASGDDELASSNHEPEAIAHRDPGQPFVKSFTPASWIFEHYASVCDFRIETLSTLMPMGKRFSRA